MKSPTDQIESKSAKSFFPYTLILKENSLFLRLYFLCKNDVVIPFDHSFAYLEMTFEVSQSWENFSWLIKGFFSMGYSHICMLCILYCWLSCTFCLCSSDISFFKGPISHLRWIIYFKWICKGFDCYFHFGHLHYMHIYCWSSSKAVWFKMFLNSTRFSPFWIIWFLSKFPHYCMFILLQEISSVW